MKNGLIFIGMFAVGISACGNSSPSTSEFRAALESRLDKKGCATSHLFNDFPVKTGVAQHNQDTLNVFENAGLIELSEDHYILSELGRADYDEDQGGFCYTQKYLISDVEIAKTIPEEQFPPMFSGAWVVSFEVKPDAVSDWAKTPEFIAAADSKSFVKFSDATTLTAQFYKIAESGKLEFKGPAAHFRPGVTFGVGF